MKKIYQEYPYKRLLLTEIIDRENKWRRLFIGKIICHSEYQLRWSIEKIINQDDQ